LSFFKKLLSALEHPVPERRLLAVQILGRLGSQEALPALGSLLATEANDVYLLREALLAISQIQGPRSRDLIQQATAHPYRLVREMADALIRRLPVSEKTLIILVRHGQTEWNRVERFRGQADVPLNEAGLAQAAATGRRVAAEWSPSAVYCSPLSRARQTAEAIARQFNLPVQSVPELIDIDYGKWQGLTPDEARQRWPRQIENWYLHPERVRIPGGESLTALRQRLLQAVQSLIDRHPGQTIVIVGHTVSNRVLLMGMFGLSNRYFWRIRQDTCALNLIEAAPGEFTLISWNDTSHLRA